METIAILFRKARQKLDNFTVTSTANIHCMLPLCSEPYVLGTKREVGDDDSKRPPSVNAPQVAQRTGWQRKIAMRTEAQRETVHYCVGKQEEISSWVHPFIHLFKKMFKYLECNRH